MNGSTTPPTATAQNTVDAISNGLQTALTVLEGIDPALVPEAAGLSAIVNGLDKILAPVVIRAFGSNAVAVDAQQAVYNRQLAFHQNMAAQFGTEARIDADPTS